MTSLSPQEPSRKKMYYYRMNTQIEFCSDACLSFNVQALSVSLFLVISDVGRFSQILVKLFRFFDDPEQF